MDICLEREIRGDDGLAYVMLLEAGMEANGEPRVTVTITNWLPPVWTSDMSLRSVSNFIKVSC